MYWWPLLSLFGISFLAATLVPAQSELALGALISLGRYDPWLLILTATAGNVLGSLVNWVLGRFLHQYRGRRWFPVSGRSLERAERIYRRWGVWTLLLSWVPIVGDPLTFVAGLLRTPLKVFLPVVAIAKAARYCAIAGVAQLF
ncbi:DedA family protein [Sphingomonas parva]|uniref:DedA family protein n=1 Tax=Sphingomonas parva TaxID=2555898 RepID=A0A4Y8ZR41_9SPHN|nr:YqaA family protein [Sphingomonas parva]TFI58444.1 DedA family protein [Sphingomonas parva]